MLIKALSDYYDLLSSEGKVLAEGYSKLDVDFLIELSEEGKMTALTDYRKEVQIPAPNGKVKIKKEPRVAIFPWRTEKTTIDGNIVEHRPLYIFGLNLDKGKLMTEDRTDKAKKSHETFVKTNLAFLEGLDSPLINAYRKFIETWIPENETENKLLLSLGTSYKSNFAFCLLGHPDKLLNEDAQIREKWELELKSSGKGGGHVAQCAVSGKDASIAQIHNKIKGIYGERSTGSVLVGFKNSATCSYGNEQSYNSNISESVMKKYTEALNYLLASKRNKIIFDGMTIVLWAMNTGEKYVNSIQALLFGSSDMMDEKATENMLKSLLQSAKSGKMTKERLSLENIDPDVDFYMVGLKSNDVRISMKFIYRKKYAELLWNIARFQEDLQITEEIRQVPLFRIKSELVSPKSKNENVSPVLISKLFESMVSGTPYPTMLLETAVRRVKTDTDINISQVRAGIIKACINRNYKKEEIKLALDRENTNQAYLCGRLFAILEKLQQEASNNSLNRTIKNAYFASASSKPALVFPKLIRLAQYHLDKVKYPVYYNKMMGEIMNKLDGEFPDTLLLKEQGEFIIGYYQQYQSFFEKKEEEN